MQLRTRERRSPRVQLRRRREPAWFVDRAGAVARRARAAGRTVVDADRSSRTCEPQSDGSGCDIQRNGDPRRPANAEAFNQPESGSQRACGGPCRVGRVENAGRTCAGGRASPASGLAADASHRDGNRVGRPHGGGGHTEQRQADGDARDCEPSPAPCRPRTPKSGTDPRQERTIGSAMAIAAMTSSRAA